jgi:hypothetical protein
MYKETKNQQTSRRHVQIWTIQNWTKKTLIT